MTNQYPRTLSRRFRARCKLFISMFNHDKKSLLYHCAMKPCQADDASGSEVPQREKAVCGDSRMAETLWRRLTPDRKHPAPGPFGPADFGAVTFVGFALRLEWCKMGYAFSLPSR